MTRSTRRFAFTVLIALGIVAGSMTVARADSANNIFRFGGAWVVPDGDVNNSNVNVDSTDGWGYFVDYERRLIPWLGIDMQVLYASPAFDVTPAGQPTTSQSLDVWTGNLGLNFHLFARSRVDLYLGVFGGYTDFSGTVGNQQLESAFGYGGDLGLDIGLTKSGLVLTMSVRYSQTDGDISGTPGSSVPYDPLVYELGLGWRF